MTRDPYLERPTPAGLVKLLIEPEADLETLENCDGFLISADGKTRSFTALTLGEIEKIMTRGALTGENRSGAHLRIPDLIIMRDRGLDSLVAAVSDLSDELPTIDAEGLS